MAGHFENGWHAASCKPSMSNDGAAMVVHAFFRGVSRTCWNPGESAVPGALSKDCPQGRCRASRAHRWHLELRKAGDISYTALVIALAVTVSQNTLINLMVGSIPKPAPKPSPVHVASNLPDPLDPQLEEAGVRNTRSRCVRSL